MKFSPTKKNATWKLHLAVSMFICFLSVVGIGCFVGSVYVKSQLSSAIAQLETRLGLEIQIEHRILSLGKLEFRGVTIGEEAIAVVGHIAANFATNPFSRQFARPTEVIVSNLHLKLTSKQLQQILTVPKTVSTPTLTEFDDGRSHAMVIKVRDGRFQIVDQNGQSLLSVAKWHADFDLREMKGNLRALGSKVWQRAIENDISMRWHWTETDEALVTRIQPSTKPNWQINLQSKIHDFDTLISWSSQGVPSWLSSQQLKGIVNNSEQIPIRARVRVFKAPDEETKFRYSGFVFAKELALHHQRIASKPVGPFPLSIKVAGTFSHSLSSLTINDGLIALKGRGATTDDPFVRFSFTAYHEEGLAHEPIFAINTKLADTSCQLLLDTVPRAMKTVLKDARLKGSAAFQASAKINLKNKQLVSLAINQAKSTCQVIDGPAILDVNRLQASQTLALKDGSGFTLGSATQAASPNFIEYAYLPRSVRLAFVSGEDTGFWQHSGIEWGSLTAAFRQNLEARRVVVGGSTISMQTAKNLFLTHSRTLGRKIEELFLTWHLEHHLSKERIFEIYTNIIEYGPNLYGIVDASRVIFNKPTYQLNLAEATFLSTLLPNPTQRFSQVCNGSLSQEYKQLIVSRLDRLVASGAVSGIQYTQAMTELDDLQFSSNAQVGARYCEPNLALRGHKEETRREPHPL